MHPDTRHSVTAYISNGTTVSFYSDHLGQISAWCEGVSQTAGLFGEGVQFVHNENNAPRMTLQEAT